MSNPAYATPDLAAVDACPGELPAGSRLGRYVVRGVLGSGGMGVVYRADDLDTGRAVALKTLHERDPMALYRLKHEFRSLADVSHPNLVSLGELAIEGGRPFFTMELVDGVDFQRWVESGPTPWEPGYFRRLRDGVRQIVLGLRALHAAGKVHCDLKPSNVLVTNDDRIVIVDFGLARDRPIIAHEASGDLFGTALYMAPEQARTYQVAASADWYCLGVVLYRFLTGVFPFRGTATDILLEKQHREPPPPSTVADGIPADLDALCVELLRRAPARRPGSARILQLLGADDTGQVSRDTTSLASVFVGRRDELALLCSALDATQQHHAAVLLHGESGVGKTALVHRFFDVVRAQSSTAVMLAGRCYQRDSMPYRALDSVIDSLSDRLRRLDQVELAAELPDDAFVLGRVFPVLARVPAIEAAACARADVVDQAHVRARVLGALRRVLSLLARRGPVIIFIDDLQWADRDGLALLGDLFHGPCAPRVLLLATVRATSSRDLARRLASLGRVTHCHVAPLPPPDAEALAAVLLQRFDPSMVTSAATIAHEAGGHPLFIDELVRFRARSRAEHTGGATGLDEAIWRRIERIDEAGRALMTAVAIAEVPLSLGVASVATGAALEESERVAERLARDHLARAVPTSDGSLALEPYHDRVRETLVGRLDPDERRFWHGRLADALYQTGGADRAPLELVRHVTLSGAAHRAADLAAHAAQRASQSLCFETAAQLYRLALSMGNKSEEAVLSLRRGLADALIFAGHGVDAATVLQQIAATVDDGHTRADCLRRAAEQLLANGHMDSGLALLDRVANEFDVRVPATNRGAIVSLVYRRARLRLRGERWHERTAADVPEHALLAQDVHHSVGAILGLVDPVRGIAMTSQATLLALRLGVRDRVVRALSVEAVCHASAGNYQRADALIERARVLAHEAGDAGALAWVTGLSAVVAYTAGRFADVVRWVDESMTLEAAVGREQWARLSTCGVYETNVLRICRMIGLAYLGHCNQLRVDFHDWLQDARRRGDRFAAANGARGLNFVWLLDDDPERARHELSADEWMPPENSFHVQHWTVLRSAVQIHLYCGTAAGARAELADQLARSKRALLMHVRPMRAEQDWMLGRLAVAEAEAAGSGSAARACHRQALAAARRLDKLGLPQSRTGASLMRAAVAHQRGDRDGAVEHLVRAESVASQTGLRIMAAAAQYRRGQLVGGSAGHALLDRVDRWARAQRIRVPHRIVRMYAPGFE